MKVNFFTRLNTWLFVVPVLIIIVLYFAVGLWFYVSGATYVLKDFHSAQLLTMLSDKKNTIELWADIRKKNLDDIAKNNIAINSLKVILKEQVAGDDSRKTDARNKKTGTAVTDSKQKIAQFIEGFGQFREISILSAEGKIVWSTKSESVGRDWYDSEILKKASSGKSDLIASKIASGANSEGLLFTAPVTAGGQELLALVVAIPNPADLAASLKVEKGFYESGKVSIIDEAGNVVAAKDMTDAGTVRYNIGHGGNGQVGYKDGLYYSAVPLRSGQLRLIATLAATEAAKPLKPLTTVYLAFAGIIVLVVLMQLLFLAPRLIEKPLSRLVRATQSIADDDLRVNLRKGYTGELKILADGFSQMIIGLNRSRTAAVRDAHVSEGGRYKQPVSDVVTAEMKARLDGIAADLDAYHADPAAGEKKIAGAASEIKGFASTVADMNNIMNFRYDRSKISQKEIRACDVLREVEAECRDLVGVREIELIVECPENISDFDIAADRRLLKIITALLLRSSIRNTEVGTITLLPSLMIKEDGEYFGLTVSDTGHGLDELLSGRIMKKDVFMAEHLELCGARAAAELLGGRIVVESSQGSGTLVTVLIPTGKSSPVDSEQVGIS